MKVVKIPVEELKKMESRGFIELVPYVHRNPFVKWLFWKRLQTALNLAENENGKMVLDFGAGSGVFMLSLSQNFKEVYSLDLDIRALKYVKKEYKLKNVRVIEGRTDRLAFEDNFFDIIFATDVLEHFRDSADIQKEFWRVLKKDGCLILSGPTENAIYRLARKFIYRRKKPSDHYTDVQDVMKKTSELFKIEKKVILPLRIIPGFKIYKARKS